MSDEIHDLTSIEKSRYSDDEYKPNKDPLIYNFYDGVSGTIHLGKYKVITEGKYSE